MIIVTFYLQDHGHGTVVYIVKRLYMCTCVYKWLDSGTYFLTLTNILFYYLQDVREDVVLIARL